MLKDELVDAEMLARFAELKPEEVEEFRHSVAPNFVPEHWWQADVQLPTGWKLWQVMQELLQNTWIVGFSVNYVVSFITLYPSTELDGDSLASWTDIKVALPYQRATMFMFNQSWRARQCNHCHKRFVARQTNDQFCSEACRIEFRRQYKAAHVRERRKQRKMKERSSNRRR